MGCCKRSEAMNQTTGGLYYTGPERRHASQPRRRHRDRRHRYRDEALLSDCRSGEARRWEDEQGFIEIANLYNDPR